MAKANENTKRPDIKKVIRQHLEIDQFLTGDFTLNSVCTQPAESAGCEAAAETSVAKDKAQALEDIARDVNGCCCCQLGKSRLNAVPGQGNPDARIAFVGEAPGGDEDARGLPFVGRAGKLLTKIINAMGLERRDVYICNILKCRPPGNRDPRPEEIIACLPYLQQQLRIIEPEVIIALGAHAARTLLDTNQAIGRLRGTFHDYYPGPDTEPIKLMATYHPAYLLRNYTRDTRQRVWEDVQKVMNLLDIEPPAK